MKRFLTLIGLSAALMLCASAPALAAAGAGSVKGNTITYTITGIPDNKPKTFSVYLLTNDAQIKCYKSKSNNPPDAKNGGKVNRNNITPAMSKGTTSSKSGLKVTGSDGSAYTVAEKVTFTYDYVNGTFSGTVTIVNPVSSLTGLAFVGRDGSNHYYPIGGTDGTIDISGYVAAVTSGYGSGSSGGSAGPGGGGSTDTGGSSTGTGGSSAGTGGAAGGSTGGSSTGSGGTGSAGSSGGGTGSGATTPAQSQQETEESRKTAEKEARKAENEGRINDIKDKINNGGSGRNGGSGSSGSGSGTGSGKEVPPCVLGRILS